MEADYQLNNKKLGRDIMKQAVSSETSPILNAQEQYGSKKYHRAVEVSLNMRLVDDLMRMLKKAGMISSTDLHTCYDRMAHVILSISLQQRGVGQEPIESTLYLSLIHI